MATRKYQAGGEYNKTTPGEKMTKPPKKVTTVSNSGDYKTITKNNTEPYGNKTGSTTKVRRTVKGVLKGAPTVSEAKQARAGKVFAGSLMTPYKKRTGDFQKGGATTKYQDGGSAPATGFEKRQAKKIARAKTRSAIANIEGEGTVSQKRDNTANRISKVAGTARAKTPKRLSTSTSSSTSTTDNRNSGNTTNTTNSGSSSGSTSGASGGQGGQGGSGGSSGSSSGVDNSKKSSTSVKQTQNNTRTNNRTSNNTSNTNVRQSQNNSRNSSKTINQSQDNSLNKGQTILNDNSRKSSVNQKSSVKQKSTTKVKMQKGGISKPQANAFKKIIDTIKKGPGVLPSNSKFGPSSRPGRDIERDIYQDRMYDMYKENAKKPKPLNKPKLKKGMYGTSMMDPSMMRKGGTKKK